MFDHYIKIPLAVNITVQRLDINGALDVLGWVKPLFEYIYNDLFYYVSLISYSSCFIYSYNCFCICQCEFYFDPQWNKF